MTSRQLTIFDSGEICSHCKQDPGILARHWPGFLDADTGQLVCSRCRSIHYQKKAASGFPGLYSEMPVQIPVPAAIKNLIRQ